MVTSLRDTLDSNDYDEFGLLQQNAAEWDIPFETQPVVSRHSFALPSGQNLSYLRWGEDEPELLFLHGGAQNAHTWDTVLLALDRPAVAVDLPGHGHSDRRPDRDYGPWRNAEAVATLMESVAPAALCVIGMSLGGATTTRLAAQRPDPCRRAMVVDATPPDQRLLPPAHECRARHRVAHRRPPDLRQLRRDGRRRGRPQPVPARLGSTARGAPQRLPARRRGATICWAPLRMNPVVPSTAPHPGSTFPRCGRT